jgi:hypothetical protein
MASEDRVTCWVSLSESAESGDLRSLEVDLRRSLGQEAVIERTMRQGDQRGEMGAAEVIPICLAATTLLLNVLKTVYEWQKNRLKESKPAPAVKVEVSGDLGHYVEVRVTRKA